MLCFAQTNLLLELQRAHAGNGFKLAMKIRRRHAVKLRQSFNGYGLIEIAPQPPNERRCSPGRFHVEAAGAALR